MGPTLNPTPAVAVIDIGSNSIKILVARRTPEGRLVALKWKTIDARISTGISRDNPQLSPAGIERGVEAVRELLADAREFAPEKTILVATSAVRDAANGAGFAAAVERLAGIPVRILTGNEEANFIGRGLTCDPALEGLQDFYVFDLGGGSLECLSFHNRSIRQAMSLPLGCVRLTEKCILDSARPMVAEERKKIASCVRESLAASGFAFDLPSPVVAVGTGGTLTTARAVLAALQNRAFDQSNTLITLSDLRILFDRLAQLGLSERRQIPALPSARADVFPTALATVIAIAEIGGFDAYRNSLYNLRWGIADDATCSIVDQP